MRVLTDTHSLVWALVDPDRLGRLARETLAEAEVMASAANLWELCVKMRKKDALLEDPVPWWEEFVVRSGIHTLGIRMRHVMALGRLPEIHKDPFDRILVAQSIVEKMPPVTRDGQLSEYGIQTIW